MSHASFLANKRVKEIFSRGDGAEKELYALLKSALSVEHESVLGSAAEDFEILTRHTFDNPPSTLGVYLRLFHGRTPSDQHLDNWGEDGPWIGPLKWFHCTYLSAIGMGFTDGDEYLCASHAGLPKPLYFYNDMVYYCGMYYGDWEIQTLP